MFRKSLVYSLAVALALMGLCTGALAAQNVANVSQKGSLLIFPKIDTSKIPNSSYNRDTIVTIGNDYYQDVWLKCYWVNHNQEIQDFMFRVTANQPVWFRASDGLGTGYYESVVGPVTASPFFPGDNETGELKCWAVDAAGINQIAWNHLYGSALIFDPVNNAAFQYNAWLFSARSVSQGGPVGANGNLILSGSAGAYDACPQYLIFNFYSVGSQIDSPGEGRYAAFVNTDLTLVPCNQDLRQDRVPTCTKAKFDIWNENETKYTGAYQCLKCWFEGYLDEIGGTIPGGFGGDKFTYQDLHTTAGRFRAQGVASSVCQNVFTKTGPDGKPVDKCWTNPADTKNHGQVATPLLGIISTEISFDKGSTRTTTGTTPNTAGAWGPPLDPASYPVPTIQWDTDIEPPQVPLR